MVASPETICMTIVCEGFVLGPDFYEIREISVVQHPSCKDPSFPTLSGIYKPRVSFQDLSPPEKETVKHWTNFHGLSYNSFYPGPSQELALQHIVQVYNEISGQDRYVVAYKGSRTLGHILERLRIPALDLNEVCCPSFSTLNQSADLDSIMNKAHLLMDWIVEQEEQDEELFYC